MKRRDFIRVGMIGGPLSLQLFLTSACTSAGKMLLDRNPAGAEMAGRKKLGLRCEVNSPGAKKHLESYILAVTAMKKAGMFLDPGKKIQNGLNWQRQAEVHQNHCTHNTWAFFPWHRDYLRRFEDIVRVMSGDMEFQLPYWDWSKNSKLPDVFNKPGSPLFVDEPTRKSDLSKAITKVAGKPVVDSLIKIKDFESFMGSSSGAGQAEYGPHNGIHVAVGSPSGVMASFMSPIDPIFWLHHCNVDRIWAEWQKANPQWKNAVEIGDKAPRWLEMKLTGFYDATGKATTLIKTAKDMLDTQALGYIYDTEAPKGAKVVWADELDTNRSPAAAAKRSRLKQVAFTRDEIKAEFGNINENGSTFTIQFPGFKGNVDKFLDGYLADPTRFEDFVFRLRVTGMPKIPNAMMSFAYLPPGMKNTKGGPLEVPLAIYSFFTGKHPAGHENMDHGGDGSPFNFDFTKLLDALIALRIKSFPDETKFKIRFGDPVTGGPVSVQERQFTEATFKVHVYEKELI